MGNIHPNSATTMIRVYVLGGCGVRVYALPRNPPWRQASGKLIVYVVNSHTNATRIEWHLWEIDLDLPLGYIPGGGRQ